MEHVYVDVLKILLALGVGSVIGEERELHKKPMGIRTISLLCIASTFITIMSLKYFPMETPRIMAGIITGIGFLGAGSIIAHQDNVKGLTTAALSWAMAIIGIGIGLGEFLLSVIAATIIFILLYIGKTTKHIGRRNNWDFSNLRK